MQRTITIPLTGTFQSLYNLINAAVVASNEAPWDRSGFELRILNPKENSGTRIQVTSDPVNKSIDRNALSEETIEYASGGAIHNSITLLNKLIRIVDLADAATTGNAIVTLESA